MVDKNAEQTLILYLAKQIKASIDESGMTQEAIAEELGVTKAAVSKWKKTGNIATYNLYMLADITSKPLTWFFPTHNKYATKRPSDDSQMHELLLENQDNAQFLEEALLAVLSAKLRTNKA